MDWTKGGVLLVWLSLTLVTAAPPPPRDVTRTALVGRLGLTIAAQTITEIATSRNQKTPLERNENPAARTPSISQVPNYRATPDPSSGEIHGYFLIPIHNTPHRITTPPNVLISLTRDGRPMSNIELETIYKNRGILENFASNITQYFPVLPIEINVPDFINTVTKWFNSIPFINSWQQAQQNEPKIHFSPLTLYLKPFNTNKNTYNGLKTMTSFRDSSGFDVGTHILPVQLLPRKNVMFVTGLTDSNYFRILNEHFRVYKEQLQQQQQTGEKLRL